MIQRPLLRTLPTRGNHQEQQAAGPWIITPRPNNEARLRLFCFHYAGGSASLYRLWPSKFPSSIEIRAIQLPGRENRLREPPLTHLAPVLEGLVAALQPLLDQPFAFFGHSLGALIAFELSRYLQVHHYPMPLHLIVSGRGAPQMPDTDPPIHQLPQHAFIDALRHLEGTPEVILQNAEMMELMLPTIRADLAISETHLYEVGKPLACPISAFGGLDDHTVAYAEVAGWREQTTQAFKLHMLPGNHFFLHSSFVKLIHAIIQDLAPYG